MAVRSASAQWNGTLQQGDGAMATESGAFDGRYSFSTRFEEEPGTNPEELIAAAHAGCFSMALSGELERAGAQPESVRTEGRVQILKDGPGFTIKKIELSTTVRASGIDEEAFQGAVQAAKDGCPVSKALASVESITVDASLES